MKLSSKMLWTFVIVALVIVLIAVLKSEKNESPKASELSSIPEEKIFFGQSRFGEIREDRSTQFLQNYTTFENSIENDLEDAWLVVESFNLTLKHGGALPMGSNREIMNLLFGANPRKIRFIDPSKTYINESGELLDRWGSALFFHFVEGQEIAIRSAGEDRIMWTGDDRTYGDLSNELE